MPADVKGPFLHTHDFDEAFYVVEGELTFQVEDELITVRKARSRSRRAGCRTRSPTAAASRPGR